MQRYFIDVPFEDGKAVLTGDDAKHIAKVMRMTAGDQIIVVAQNEAHICTITHVEQDITVQQTGATIIGIKKGEGIIISPGPYAELQARDTLYFVGSDNCFATVKQFLNSH